MSYLDKLTQQVQELFEQAGNINELQQKVLDMVQSKAKESFKNGLETGLKRQSKSKGRKTSRS